MALGSASVPASASGGEQRGGRRSGSGTGPDRALHAGDAGREGTTGAGLAPMSSATSERGGRAVGR
eukprot:6547447-Alexandrium_andersonii.AAC.1